MLIDGLANPEILLPEDGLGQGAAHSGALQAARGLVAHLEETGCLEELLAVSENGEPYRVLLTGHSLAGAVVALVAAALKGKGLAQVEAYAFCPMPVLTREAAERTEGHAISL